MQKPSSLFFNAVSCVDHAMIVDGKIVGGSVLPNIIITGNVDPKESVVVDFSTLKKSIKAIIDHPEYGFDHKLWVDPSDPNTTLDTSIDGRIRVKTRWVEFEGPADAVKFVNLKRGVDEDMAELLTEKLREEYPDVDITAHVSWKSDDAHTYGSTTAFFTYVHGLKDSTSRGCNNLAHGHLSYIEVIADPLIARMFSQQLAAELNGIIFVNRENVIRETDKSITFGYQNTYCGRGMFRMKLDTTQHKVAILGGETTIECLVEEVTSQYSDDALRAMGITHIMISEGLQKGAVREVPALLTTNGGKV